MKHGHLFQDTQLGRRAIAMLKVTIVMYRATGCAVLRRAVLKSNVSCRVELYRALLHCGSSRPWRRNPDRTDLGSKLELPERIARASCNRNARGARPARAQDHIQFRSPRSIHRRPKPDRTDVDLKVELLERTIANGSRCSRYRS